MAYAKPNYVHHQANTAHNISNDLASKTMSHPRKTEVMDSVSDSGGGTNI